MIYLSDIVFIEDKFKFKQKLLYNNNWSFIPLIYDNDDLIIQTQLLYSQFGINKNFNFIDLSIKNINNDKKVKSFYDNMNIIINIINKKIKSNHSINDIFKDFDNEKILRIKCNNNFVIFNQYKKKIDNIPNNSYGNYIIHFVGLWINKNKIFLKCNLLQAKINIPLFLEEYSFIDNYKKSIPIPPPPPLPIFRKTNNKIIITKKNNNKKYQINDRIKLPTLNDIKFALKNLKSI